MQTPGPPEIYRRPGRHPGKGQVAGARSAPEQGPIEAHTAAVTGGRPTSGRASSTATERLICTDKSLLSCRALLWPGRPKQEAGKNAGRGSSLSCPILCLAGGPRVAPEVSGANRYLAAAHLAGIPGSCASVFVSGQDRKGWCQGCWRAARRHAV